MLSYRLFAPDNVRRVIYRSGVYSVVALLSSSFLRVLTKVAKLIINLTIDGAFASVGRNADSLPLFRM